MRPFPEKKQTIDLAIMCLPLYNLDLQIMMQYLWYVMNTFCCIPQDFNNNGASFLPNIVHEYSIVYSIRIRITCSEPLQVMAEMRHPHVVQFLGLCFLEGSTLPVLVMERLDSSLDDLLESTPSLPLPLKQSLLVDIVRGLLYLHTRNPPVVHRDLSARNVLLTSSLVAKVSDLGNARIVNLQPGQLARTLTRLPGTMAYMPPEAFDQHSQYGPRLDIFSFGHLTLFTLTQVREG